VNIGGWAARNRTSARNGGSVGVCNASVVLLLSVGRCGRGSMGLGCLGCLGLGLCLVLSVLGYMVVGMLVALRPVRRELLAPVHKVGG
jgi:O-antigen ligase